MNFVLIGVAGYVAPKHLKAIKDIGGTLLAVLDPHSSVGVLDSYFPDCQYFKEFERFDRFCSKNGSIDYVSICSPNYLHDSHCRFGLRIGANVICEKPLVLNERNLEGLLKIEEKYNKKINCILQLRLNEELIKLKNKIQKGLVIVDNPSLIYYTPRGDWYKYTWKSNIEKSGGLTTNIGVHLFDILQWLFGPYKKVEIKRKCSNSVTLEKIMGVIHFKEVSVNFILSIDKNHKPIRLLKIDNYEWSFSTGFNNLHTKSYEEIIKGNGFGIEDVRPSIKLSEKLRN